MFSNYLFAIPIKGKTAAVVAQAFLDNVIGQGGAVMAIHSDNGREMKNNLFSKMTRILHIKHTFSMPYHPEGNSVIESSHHRIKMILRASLGRQPSQLWTTAVKGAVHTLNSLEHPLTGLTPNFLFYGRELPTSCKFGPPTQGGLRSSFSPRPSYTTSSTERSVPQSTTLWNGSFTEKKSPSREYGSPPIPIDLIHRTELYSV